MSALLDDASFFKDDNPVRMLDGRQPVCSDQRGLACTFSADVVNNARLGSGIDRR